MHKIIPGVPLIAQMEGLGYTRNGPDLRRLIGIAQLAMGPADPASYARYIRRDPLPFEYETGDVKAERDAGRVTPMVVFHTVGDSNAPIVSVSPSRLARMPSWTYLAERAQT